MKALVWPYLNVCHPCIWLCHLLLRLLANGVILCENAIIMQS